MKTRTRQIVRRRIGTFGFLGQTGATGNADMGGTNFGLTSPSNWGTSPAAPVASRSTAIVPSPGGAVAAPVSAPAPAGGVFGLSMTQTVVIGVALGLAALLWMFPSDERHP